MNHVMGSFGGFNEKSLTNFSIFLLLKYGGKDTLFARLHNTKYPNQYYKMYIWTRTIHNKVQICIYSNRFGLFSKAKESQNAIVETQNFRLYT